MPPGRPRLPRCEAHATADHRACRQCPACCALRGVEPAPTCHAHIGASDSVRSRCRLCRALNGTGEPAKRQSGTPGWTRAKRRKAEQDTP